jgi:hypothetical protein
MRGITGRTTSTIVLLAVLMMLPGQQPQHLLTGPASSEAPATLTATTPSGPDAPLSVAPANTSYTGELADVAGPATSATGEQLSSDVLAAYTLAIAVAPPGCHLSLPLLAAIGQVESGNLTGRTVDLNNRVAPAIVGPVLNGKGSGRAVADTDGGVWDGNRRWDRALGPFHLLPSSWRVAGVDMDADGVRDPQNIADSAGAVMVYLCARGRDLATPAGLRQGVLAYRHSARYLALVLAWKAALDHADLTGAGEPVLYGAWARPTTQTAPADLSADASTPRDTARHQVKHTASTAKPTPATPSSATPSTEPDPTPTATPSATPPATTTTPTAPTTPTTPATPTAPTAPTKPTTTAPPEPTKDPDPTTPAEPLPTCPVPTDGDPTTLVPPQPPATPVEPPAGTPPGEVVVDPTDPDALCVIPVDPDDPEAQVPGQTPAPGPTP